MADLIDNPRDLSGRPWGRKRQENGLNRHHKRHHVGYPVVELSLRTIHTSHVSVASASAHSVSPRAFRARKLIPTVPNCAALDDCGAPAKTSARLLRDAHRASSILR
jgi:hypothetical protein